MDAVHPTDDVDKLVEGLKKVLAKPVDYVLSVDGVNNVCKFTGRIVREYGCY